MKNPTRGAALENNSAPRPYPIVLKTEAENEFASLLAKLEQDIRPNTFIERMYVQDIAALIWEIIRFRRFKTAILDNALREALTNLLKQILFKPELLQKPDYELEAEALAVDWFRNQKAKAEVAKLLGQFDLDKSAIEAEAFRLTSSDIDRLDRMLTVLEIRRDKALHCIADYRDSLAERLQQSSQQILEAADVLHIEHKPTTKN